MELTKGQEQFKQAVLDGKNVYLTGKAGTGKTTVAKHVIQLLKDKGLNVILVAPTGIASSNLGGQTMHSMFAIPPFGILDEETEVNFIKKEKRRILQYADVIVFDEISMIRPDQIDYIDRFFYKNSVGSFSNKQLIFIGDLEQLPPVLKEADEVMLKRLYESHIFYYANFFKKVELIHVDLEEVKRQSDNEFIEALNIVRSGGKTEYFRKFISKEPSGVILAPHKDTVDFYNEKGLSLLEGETFKFKAVFSDAKVKPDDFNIDPLLVLKNGAKIMYLVNSGCLYNGSLGTFVAKEKTEHIEPEEVMGNYFDFYDFFIDVNGILYPLKINVFEKKEYVLEIDEETGKEDFKLRSVGFVKQLPVRLAYAMTIHKSQGLTFDEVTIDLTRKCFAKGQVYTALSRVRTPQGLKIIARES